MSRIGPEVELQPDSSSQHANSDISDLGTTGRKSRNSTSIQSIHSVCAVKLLESKTNTLVLRTRLRVRTSAVRLSKFSD